MLCLQQPNYQNVAKTEWQCPSPQHTTTQHSLPSINNFKIYNQYNMAEISTVV